MTILTMMLRAARPSRISDMRAVVKPFWISKGYRGMTFFGYIITHSLQDAEDFNRGFNALKNHEMIHLYQARACHDSWLRFYWLYLRYWLLASRYCRRLKNADYLLNPFELEAYCHMYDLDYLKDKEDGTDGWRHYAQMSLEERLKHYQNTISGVRK